MMTVLLANATLVTFSPSTLRTAHLTVRDNTIGEILDDGSEEEFDEIVDCTGKLVVPGNVCAHTHLYSTLARGMPGPDASPTNFLEILQRVWWRLDKALDEDSIRASSLIGALDALRSGSTTLIDHHASPNSIEDSLDVVAGSLEQAGLRGVVCYEVSDRDGRARRDAGLRENDRFLRVNQRSLVRANVGAHASFTLEDDSLAELSELARHHNTGVHIHVAEDLCDEEDALRRCGKSAVARLDAAGIFGPGSIAAHCVHLQEEEIAVLRRRESWLIHNCRSNMNNCVGRAQVDRFGPRAALGTDGIDGDMFAESRTAYFRAREASMSADPERFMTMLAAGAALASQYFDQPIGLLEPGAAADLVVLEYDPPTNLDASNAAWHWMFALSAGNVESVMVGGKWVMRHGEMINVDEEKIRSEARVQAHRLWHRMRVT